MLFYLPKFSKVKELAKNLSWIHVTTKVHGLDFWVKIQ